MDVTELSEAMLQCRTFGHRWSEAPGDLREHGRRMEIGYRMLHRCDTCGSEREVVINRRTGIIQSRTYRHPRNWAKVEFVGSGGVGRGAYRLEFLKRRGELAQPRRRRDAS